MPPTAESESTTWVTDAVYGGVNKRNGYHDSDGNSQGYESDIQRQRRIGHAAVVDLDIEDKGENDWDTGDMERACEYRSTTEWEPSRE